MEQTSSEIELVFNGVQSLRTFVPTFLAASGAVAQAAGAAGVGAAGAPLLGDLGLADGHERVLRPPLYRHQWPVLPAGHGLQGHRLSSLLLTTGQSLVIIPTVINC